MFPKSQFPGWSCRSDLGSQLSAKPARSKPDGDWNSSPLSAIASSTSARPLLRPKLTKKLYAWWELDFDAFRAEVNRTFSREIPLKERADWERYLTENAAEVRALSASIADAEREIDAIVYRLFDLTPEEITLLEASLEGQY